MSVYLSPREQKVIPLIAEGHSLKETAYLLGRSRKTIETQVGNFMKRHKISNRAELVLFAIRHSIIKVEVEDESETLHDHRANLVGN